MANGRLLIFDDEAEVGQTIKLIAEDIGLTARYTTDPDEFFSIAKEWDPTHIALDLIMPEMDGVQVLGMLAEYDCTANIIITSGVGQRVLDAAGRSASEHGLNIIGMLSKPFSPDALQDLLKIEDQSSQTGTRTRPGFPNITAEDLQQAITEKQFHLMYQPKIQCDSGKLAGFEALIRWEKPEHGFIPPDQFIPLAEKNGLIGEITDEVLEQSLRWYSGFRKSGLLSDNSMQLITISINISARSLNDFLFVDRILSRCDALGIDPSSLIFELTETSAMADPTASLDLLTRLRVKGFQLSIDDFGTGYSSMLQLVRLPFSEIKVDKSFVMTAMRSEESRTVIRSIVELGHSLGLDATAEGVEDAETLEYLKQVGCDLAQGYYIGKPLLEDKIMDWITDNIN